MADADTIEMAVSFHGQLPDRRSHITNLSLVHLCLIALYLCLQCQLRGAFAL
jgi:hypothetical protein